ncbi:hypothetical protein BpHYR1_008202, partial [Brachionus plicatilis]
LNIGKRRKRINDKSEESIEIQRLLQEENNEEESDGTEDFEESLDGEETCLEKELQYSNYEDYNDFEDDENDFQLPHYFYKAVLLEKQKNFSKNNIKFEILRQNNP